KQIEKKKKEIEKHSNEEKIENKILIEEVENDTNNISEEKLGLSQEVIVGLFDPEINNLNLDMWVNTDGLEIKTTLTRIDKLNLSKFSKDLLFKTLFTNSYPPSNNLSSEEFLSLKIDWLIKERRNQDLEKLLDQNFKFIKDPKATTYLINEAMSSSKFEQACGNLKYVNNSFQNKYLEKFKVYCLFYENKIEEAQLNYDLLLEKGFNEKFFQEKMNYLFNYSEKTSNKVLDNDLLNFHLSRITSKNFEYLPSEKTPDYIWKYLSSSNLLDTSDLEELKNSELISLYEEAASNNSFEKKEIFNIYKKFLFKIDQFLNAKEAIKTLPNYQARALLYQTILLSEKAETKLELILLLNNLFEKDDIPEVFDEEIIILLKKIDKEEIPSRYTSIVDNYLVKSKQIRKKIKYNNDILHKSKILRYFFDDGYKENKIDKDLKQIFKKIKKNKKYFFSINDAIILQALKSDEIKVPQNKDFLDLISKLTVPEDLNNLIQNDQLGLILLKIVEIIGEDKLEDLDPETVYFINNVLSKLKLRKIRNEILITTLPNYI
ncbi:MAG: hypothetical protein CBC24_00455, partial [Candidatus Pelagibacter sp. TMED64]